MMFLIYLFRFSGKLIAIFVIKIDFKNIFLHFLKPAVIYYRVIGSHFMGQNCTLTEADNLTTRNTFSFEPRLAEMTQISVKDAICSRKLVYWAT